MDAALVTEIILGVAAGGVGLASYIFAARAHREQAVAAELSVDATAYVRAKEIYEGSMQELRSQITDLHAEILRMREANLTLEQHNVALREEINGLRIEVSSLRARLG